MEIMSRSVPRVEAAGTAQIEKLMRTVLQKLEQTDLFVLTRINYLMLIKSLSA